VRDLQAAALQYPRLAPPPPELPPPKLLPELSEDDELDSLRRGSSFVYSLVKLQNAHCSTTRALPLDSVVAAEMTCSFDDLVRWPHCGQFPYPLTHFG
jgi:hypothetical protein